MDLDRSLRAHHRPLSLFTEHSKEGKVFKCGQYFEGSTKSNRFLFIEHPLFWLFPNPPLPFATCEAERPLLPADLGAGTLLGSVIKMKFTAGTPAEALEQIHPQPGTGRDAPSGDCQRFGNWRSCRAAVVPTRGRLRVAMPPRDGERSPARLKIPFLTRCAGLRVGPAPSAKPSPLMAVETAALETSCDPDLV